MKNLFIIKVLLFLAFGNSYAKKAFYPVSEIPQTLQNTAVAVVRYDSTFLKVTDEKAVSKRKMIITVLKKEGDFMGVFREAYNKFTKIQDISGELYDADGSHVKSLKKSEIVDVSSFGSSFVFHDDLRIKFYDFNHRVYPYTVVYEFENETQGSFFSQSWRPQPSEEVAVQYSVFEMKHNLSLAINHRAFSLPKNVIKTISKDTAYYNLKWSVSDLAAFHRQEQAVNHDYLPCVKFVQENVAFEKFKGSSKTWQSYGKLFYEINKDRDELSPEVVGKLKAMTDNVSDTKGKIAILYEYMQKNTRYVANEYGLAGYQTFLATDVNRVGYGDCKGLSNYMKAMLKAVGISSNLVLVSAGSNNFYKVDPNFVYNGFNHMILCVPQGKDTLWLECTSSDDPPGYMGAFTQDRLALVLTDKGGVLSRTPKYGKEATFTNRDIELWINDKDEKSKIVWNTVYSGVNQDRLTSLYKKGSKSEIEERLLKVIPYKGLELIKNTFEINHQPFQIPTINEYVELTANSFAEATTKRLFVNIPLNVNPMPEIESFDKRTEPFELIQGFKNTYHLKINLPEGYQVESLPQAFKYNEEFGFIESKVNVDKNVCVVDFIVEQKSGVYPASLFENYTKMYNSVNKLFSSIQLTLTK